MATPSTAPYVALLVVRVLLMSIGLLPVMTFIFHTFDIETSPLKFLDDAYFYTTLTFNYVNFQSLSLDTQSPSNGFQPLFLYALIGLAKLCSVMDKDGLLSLHLILVYFFIMMFPFCLLLTTIRSGWVTSIAVCAFVISITQLGFLEKILSGLETPILVSIFVLFGIKVMSLKKTASTKDFAILAFLCSLIAFARVDWAIIFPATVIILCINLDIKNWLRFLIPFTLFSMPFAAYLFNNLLDFGSPTPISGRVKQYYLSQYATDYWRSDEWHGLPSLFAELYNLEPSSTMYYFVLITVAIVFLACLVKHRAFDSFSHRVFIGIASAGALAHIAVLFSHGELRPYTNYYFVIEFLFFHGLVTTIVILKLHRFFQRWHTSLATFLVCVSLPISSVYATSQTLSRKEVVSKSTKNRVELSRRLHEILACRGGPLGAYWPGYFSFYSETFVTSVDGIIGSNEQFQSLKNNSELDLFLERGNCLIIPLDPNEFHISKKIEAKKIPKEGNWPLHGYRSLRSFDGNIVLVDREGWWSVLHLEKSKS